jgi:hypothetical protein
MVDFDDQFDLGDEGGTQIPTGMDDFMTEQTNKGQVIGSWGFNSNIDFSNMSAEESNVWFFEQVFNFLRAFFNVVVPDNVEVITYNASQQITRENLDQMTFLDELMLIMKQLKEPLWVIRLNLNIVGFLRTETDPDQPVRLQIQEPASFIVWGGPDETGFQTFSISYRLFSEQSLKAEHALLWSVNQPLLEKALKKWEQQSQHKIDVVQSNSDDLPLYQHGFSRPAPGRAKPRPKNQYDDGDELIDDIPDLDDLLL